MGQQSSEDPTSEGWCYTTLPPARASSPGYQGLIVTFHAPPGHHSNVETLHVRLRDEDGLASWTTLHGASKLKGSLFLCIGRITLCERSDRRSAFFSFGGTLGAAVQEQVTVFEIRSPAPILGVTSPPQAVSAQLAAETEALLAEAEARWEPDDQRFLRRLAQLDPLRCYQAVLRSLHSRYEQAAALRQSLQPLYEIIHREREWFMEAHQWPGESIGLEELLAPP